MSETRNVALYIEPPSYHFLRDQLFNLNDGRLNGDGMNAPYVHLRNFFAARGITVRTADYLPPQQGSVRNIYVSMGMLQNCRTLARRQDTVLSGFFAMECPVADPHLYRALPQCQRDFKRIFSWSDGPSLEPFVGQPLCLESIRWPQAFDDVHEGIWSGTDRKFLVMINANKLPRLYFRELYTERLRALAFFGRTGAIDLYGTGWNAPSHRVGKTWMPYTLLRVHRTLLHHWQRIRPHPLLEAARRVYCGPAKSKAETLGRYKFAICFENSILKGWITEKIFDCFFAGTVPVYLGAPDVEEHVPAECFIDMRRFASYADLAAFLKSLSEMELRRYRERAREFIRSSQFHPHSKQAFVDLFRRIVEEDAGTRLT